MDKFVYSYSRKIETGQHLLDKIGFLDWKTLTTQATTCNSLSAASPIC